MSYILALAFIALTVIGSYLQKKEGKRQKEKSKPVIRQMPIRFDEKF